MQRWQYAGKTGYTKTRIVQREGIFGTGSSQYVYTRTCPLMVGSTHDSIKTYLVDLRQIVICVKKRLSAGLLMVAAVAL